MKQVSQNYKSGDVSLTDVAEPKCRRGGLLVATEYSAVSAGTEGMKVREGSMSYAGMARARPDQVKKVIESVRQQGIMATYEKVMNRLDSLTPLGYSIAGVVTEVGEGVSEFRVGQRVACGGAGYANHASTVFVPQNLCVAVPDDVASEDASFATIGAIAMQGYRQSEMQLSETAVVIGLGLIGQILVQILVAAGIRVVGVDLSEERNALAVTAGAEAAFKPDDTGLRSTLSRLTGGAGADCVFLTAGGKSNGPTELAVAVARDRARVVDIGKTKLDLPWNDYYEKELDVRFSRSYGPGRYDPNYEERGVDYPIGYVRWTERRNMDSFIQLLDSKSLDMSLLIDTVVDFDDAESLYKNLAENPNESLGIVFRHPVADELATPIGAAQWPRVQDVVSPAADGEVAIGVIGAGNYASTMLLPHLAKDRRVQLSAVATTSGLTAKNAARKFQFETTTTDYRQIIEANDISTVLIATHHATHAPFAAKALAAGKSVYVEKPLAIDRAGLQQVVAAMRAHQNDRIMVGFNRRFAPLVDDLMAFKMTAPMSATYRVQAGQLDAGSWYLDPNEGGRFAGEAGHFFDLLSFVLGARPIAVHASAVAGQPALVDDADNVMATVEYDSGALASLVYVTQGGTGLPKERLEVHGGGQSAVLDNFTSLSLYDGAGRAKTQSRSTDKGQSQQMKAWVDGLLEGRGAPITATEILDTTLVTLAALESIKTGRAVRLAEFLE